MSEIEAKDSFKILIVDDVPANTMLLKAILKKEGYTIEIAENGQIALQKIEQENPDLVLLDIMMPVLNGYDTLVAIRENERTKELPVIMLTALNETENIVKGFQLGANDYLSKPFKKEELIIRVHYQLTLLNAKRTILRQQQKLLEVITGRDKMYSVISHDLRSPISSIKMMSNLLSTLVRQDENINPDIKDLTQMVEKSSDEIYNLLDNLLKWTKNQLGALKPVMQNLDLSQELNAVIDMCTPIANEKSIILVAEKPETITINADSEMVKSTVRNLIVNAIKFSNKNSRIEIKCEDKDSEILISVKDEGKGISKENQSKLLKENSHYTTYGTNNEKGSGLGLLLCRDFIILHNGKFWFESEENVGTTFYFTLPKQQ